MQGSITSPYHWPSEGIVTLKNVKLRCDAILEALMNYQLNTKPLCYRYQDHLPWALNSVSLTTKAGEKVRLQTFLKLT